MSTIRQFHRGSAAILLAFMVVCGLAARSADAAVYTWADVSSTWTAGSSWGGTAPAPSDIAQFTNSNYNFLPTLTTTSTAGAVWDNGSGTLIISGSGLLALTGATINSTTGVGIELDAGAGGLTFSSSIGASSNLNLINNSTAPLNILGTLNNVTHQVTVSGTGNTFIAGNITGGTNGSFIKTGPSVLTLTLTNVSTGSITVSEGTLQVGNGGAQGSLVNTPVAINAAGTLTYTVTNNQSFLGSFSGAGIWNLSGGSSTVFTLSGGATGFSGTLNVNSGIFTASGIGVRLPSSATINVASGSEFLLSNGTCTTPITINGFGPTLGGALVAGSSSSLNGNITLAGNAQISTTNSTTINGSISGPYQLTLFETSSANSIVLAGSNSYSSTVLAGTGSVTVSNSNALSSGPLSFVGGATLKTNFNIGVASLSGSIGQIQNSSAGTKTLTVGSDNSNTTFGGTLVGSGGTALALSKIGSGSLTLTGVNPFAGPTNLSSGTLQLANALALANSPVTIGTGTLYISGVSTTLTSLSGGGQVTLNAGTLILGGIASSSYGGIIGGNGGLVQNNIGSVTLSGNSNFSGTTLLNNGALVLANSAGSALGTSALSLNGTLSSAPGGGGLTAGTVTAGTTSHSISPGGDGTIGPLGVGGLTINSLSTLRFDISGISSYDQINDGGALSFSGSGAASLLVPSSIPYGLYKLMTYSSTSSIDPTNLSLGLIGGGAVPPTYRLQLTPTELDLFKGNATNDTVLAASASAVAFGRVMLSNVPSSNVAISLSSGTSQTGFSASTSGGAAALASGNGPGAIPPSGNVAVSLTNATGSYSGTVFVQNSGDDGTGPGSAGPGLGAEQPPIPISVTGTVVDNRVVTSTSASFALIHLGQSVGSLPITLSTIGDDNQFTRVTVLNGSDANGLAVSGGSNTLFNSPTATDSRTLGGTPNAAGIINGALVLTTNGEGLAGESPINVSVAYTVPVFSGSARWNGGSSSWGTGSNWNDQLTPAIGAAPGTFAGYSDAAAFDDGASNRAVNLNGTSPHLMSMTLADTTGSGYTLAQGSGGTLVMDNGAGTAAISVISGTHTITAPVTLSSVTSIASIGGTLLLNTTLSGSGSLITTGSGQLTLPGADTLSISGGVSVSSGTLAAPLGIPHGGGAIDVAGGATFAAGGQVKRAVSGNGAVTAISDLIIGNSTQPGQFNQGGSPGTGGTLNAGGNAVAIFSSSTAVLGSQTNIDEGGSLTTLNGAQLGNPASLDATKVLTATGNATINGNFVNNGVVNGPTGAGEQLAFTQFVKGAGSTTGNIEYQGSYSPGNSPAAVSVENMQLDSSSTLILELAGSNAGSGYDQLEISGMVTLNGTLKLTLLDGFMPSAGESFNFFNGPTTGSFTQLNLPPLDNGLSWDTSSLYTGGAITAVPEPSALALVFAFLFCLTALAQRWPMRPKSA